jgi:hypothetical protein
MGIDLYRVSEWNERQDYLGDPKSVLPALLDRARARSWELVKYIDPYGDTVFNHLQTSTLLAEFRLLEEYCRSEEERAWLADAVALIAQSGEVHTYIKLIGD